MALKSVAILGCGPAGLMVAHAAQLSNWDFRIYSRKQMSELFGAQYLHAAIPGLEIGTPRTVKYSLNGTPEQYRKKVYGDIWDGAVSPEDLLEEHYAWDLRQAYERLWFMYSDEIIDYEIRKNNIYIIDNTSQADLVISTVPRTLWDNNNAHFERSYIWALGDAVLPRVDHTYRPEPFSVMCDARPFIQWYRVSNIFGYCTMEWPQWWNHPYATVTPPVKGASLVTKPLRYTGNAAPDFIHLGRYGAWQKGVLTSDVFFEAAKIFASDKIET